MSIFNPLDYPICFAYPLRLASSTWIEHVPFGMFLIDVLRPQVLVELGTFRGVSYCAFCQAVKYLQLDSRCYAIDTWSGDPQNGFYQPSQVLEELRQHHDPLYGSFSRLIQSTFDDAVAHFGDETINLLHIDGYHTYEAVRHDWEMWLPKMNKRGVVLLHDTNVREKDFGVWKFWDELKRHYLHLEFKHGYGLGVLFLGDSYPRPLDSFADPAGSAGIREFFYQVGYRLETSEKETVMHELAEQKERLRMALEAPVQLRAELDTLRTELDTIYGSRGWQLLSKYRAMVARWHMLPPHVGV